MLGLLETELSVDCTDSQTIRNEFRRNHISASHHLMRGTVVDNPSDAPTNHRGISANTPQPRYSRV